MDEKIELRAVDRDHEGRCALCGDGFASEEPGWEPYLVDSGRPVCETCLQARRPDLMDRFGVGEPTPEDRRRDYARARHLPWAPRIVLEMTIGPVEGICPICHEPVVVGEAGPYAVLGAPPYRPVCPTCVERFEPGIWMYIGLSPGVAEKARTLQDVARMRSRWGLDDPDAGSGAIVLGMLSTEADETTEGGAR